MRTQSMSLPYYEQLVLQIKQQIVQGVFLPGERLPSVREMARQVHLNPNTVSKAYKQLEQEQVTVTVKGKGTYVNHVVNNTIDASRLQAAKAQLERAITELQLQGITEQQATAWVKGAYRQGETA